VPDPKGVQPLFLPEVPAQPEFLNFGLPATNGYIWSSNLIVNPSHQPNSSPRSVSGGSCPHTGSPPTSMNNSINVNDANVFSTGSPGTPGLATHTFAHLKGILGIGRRGSATLSTQTAGRRGSTTMSTQAAELAEKKIEFVCQQMSKLGVQPPGHRNSIESHIFNSQRRGSAIVPGNIPVGPSLAIQSSRRNQSEVAGCRSCHSDTARRVSVA